MVPSDFVQPGPADECAAEVLRTLKAQGVHRFGVRVNHAGDYPARLRDARHPVELLYYQGAWELTETRCVAVVGTRKPTG
jgi:DNA processing protein